MFGVEDVRFVKAKIRGESDYDIYAVGFESDDTVVLVDVRTGKVYRFSLCDDEVDNIEKFLRALENVLVLLDDYSEIEVFSDVFDLVESFK